MCEKLTVESTNAGRRRTLQDMVGPVNIHYEGKREWYT